MFYNFQKYALVVVLAFSMASAFTEKRLLRRLAHPSTLALEILPRHPSPTPAPYKRSITSLRSTALRHDDTFRLTLVAFGDTFYLHLRPNHDLIHPDARLNFYHAPLDGGPSQLTHSIPLHRESVKAYWGEVVDPIHSHARLQDDMAGVLARPARPPSDLGWARIMVHHQGDELAGIAPVFEGAFTANGVTYNIVTKDNYLRHKHPLDPDVPLVDGLDSQLVIWRDSDVMTVHEMQGGHPVKPPPRTCGHDSFQYNTDPRLNPALRKPVSVYDSFGLYNPFERRDDIAGSGSGSNFAGSIGNNAGCPANQKVLYMGVAADCEYTDQYGSQQNATTQILTNWNTASALYKRTFNVSLGIIELQVQNSTCPTTADPSIPWNVDCDTLDLNDRLSVFSGWRGAKGNDQAGLWHLMSGCPTGTEVGIAWLSTLCQQTSSGSSPSIVSGTAVSTAGRVEWQVISHEIGHNFGAIHDCTDGCNSTVSCCPLSSGSCDANSEYLMSPTADAGEMNFSPCSLGNICSLMQGSSSGGATNTSCLLDPNPNAQVITLNMCGNGIVETGEQCDPGEGVQSPCCDSATCQFLPGAVCDPASSPCCTEQCNFSPSTQVCRPAVDPTCDTAEMCTGNSSACPPDLFASNGRSCGPSGLACASGQCTSLTKQCQEAGSSLNLSQACPSQNQQSCQVSCQDPTQSNQCVQLQTILVDGSPCGYGGTCVEGNCQSAGLLDTIKAWYTQNLQISIPVSIAVGILLIVILWFIITGLKRCCTKQRRPAAPIDPALKKAKHVRLPSQDLPPAVPVFVPGPAGPVLVAEGKHVRRKEQEVPRELPAALQAGSRVARSRTPAAIADRSQPGTNSQSDWVDERLWNGR